MIFLIYIKKDYDAIIKKLGIQKKEFNLISDNKCCICYNDNYNFYTSCNHPFCFDCFLIWYIKHNNKECSYCKQKIISELCSIKI